MTTFPLNTLFDAPFACIHEGEKSFTTCRIMLDMIISPFSPVNHLIPPIHLNIRASVGLFSPCLDLGEIVLKRYKI